MNPLYDMLMGGQQAPQQPQMPQPTNAMSPFQRIGMIRQAMANPAAFVKQQFPDIPDQIANDPNQILNYLQQTRGISNQQIQQLYGMYGGR